MQKSILASLGSIVTSIHLGLLVRDVPGDDIGYIIVNVIDYMYLQFRTELLQCYDACLICTWADHNDMYLMPLVMVLVWA